MSWPVETIPDSAYLFRRVHKNHAIGPTLTYKVIFKNHLGGMSVDWDEYASSEDTQNGGPQSAENYGVIKLNTGDVRKMKSQSVEHKPTKNNQAHSAVVGEKSEEVIINLKRILEWEINIK